MTGQQLDFGPIQLTQPDDQAALYMLAGEKMYLLGAISGALEPIGAEHIVGEMGGLWAHPVKFMDGWYPVVYTAQHSTTVTNAAQFVGRLSDVTFQQQVDDLTIERTDVIAEHDAGLFALLTVTNHGTVAWQGALGMRARINILPCWFGGWEAGSTKVHHEHGLVLGYPTGWQDQWGFAFGANLPPKEIVFADDAGKSTVELRFDLALAPGQQHTWEFLFTTDHQQGHIGAHQLWTRLAGRSQSVLAAKRARYAEIAWGGVQLTTPDTAFNHEYALAKVNLHMLYADYGPYLPGYFLAGVPEYPQLFGCDTTYSAAGVAAAGYGSRIKSALSLLAERARMACGRVPHEITTNGRIFNPGNTQETPQFTLAVWDYVRWSGDLPFLRQMYPLCREGVMEYVAGLWDHDGTGYPWGDAMVERSGMGSFKLDSACYLYAAWQALAEMATVLERPEAAAYRERAARWLGRFERDWWLPEQQLYADSLHTDLRPQLDGHWTQVIPVQLGIAAPERAELVLDELHRSFVNHYGLVHTREREDRVWTLPTGLLALANLRYGRVAAAVTQLHNIALTTHTGMLGAFEELIPAGLCFMQLWSAAIYVQCVIEGLLGLEPRAFAHELTLRPALPADWPAVELKNLQVGSHQLDLAISQQSSIISHLAGPAPLVVRYSIRGTTIASLGTHGRVAGPVTLEAAPGGDLLVFAVPPAATVTIMLRDQQATIRFAERRTTEV